MIRALVVSHVHCTCSPIVVVMPCSQLIHTFLHFIGLFTVCPLAFLRLVDMPTNEAQNEARPLLKLLVGKSTEAKISTIRCSCTCVHVAIEYDVYRSFFAVTSDRVGIVGLSQEPELQSAKNWVLSLLLLYHGQFS